MYWSQRPLCKQMLQAAAADVSCLVPYIYDNINRYIAYNRYKSIREIYNENNNNNSNNNNNNNNDNNNNNSNKIIKRYFH